ncbi:hypothetical protein [Rickettsia endosymbiont of Orchestes rusci]
MTRVFEEVIPAKAGIQKKNSKNAMEIIILFSGLLQPRSSLSSDV